MLMALLWVEDYFVVDNSYNHYCDDNGFPANFYPQNFQGVGIVIIIKSGKVTKAYSDYHYASFKLPIGKIGAKNTCTS